MESPKNHQERERETPNRLLDALAASWKRVEKKRSPKEKSRLVKGINTQGTRFVRWDARPDLSCETWIFGLKIGSRKS
jgi:hypothetical protein